VNFTFTFTVYFFIKFLYTAWW